MLVVKSVGGRFTPRAALIREIEPILLLFGAENFLDLKIGGVRFGGGKSVEDVPRIAQIARIQRFVVF